MSNQFTRFGDPFGKRLGLGWRWRKPLEGSGGGGQEAALLFAGF